MRVATDLGELWGGVIYDLRYDLPLHRLTLHIKVKGENHLKFYELNFLSISNYVINNNLMYPFDYVELTTIEVSKDASGVYAKLEISSEEYSMVIKCIDYSFFIIAEED